MKMKITIEIKHLAQQEYEALQWPIKKKYKH